MANNYSHSVENGIFKIYINNIVHLSFRCSDLITYQSWVENRSFYDIVKTFFHSLIFEKKLEYWSKKYIIEFILTNNAVTFVEYDDQNKWKEILKLVDKL